VSDGDPAYVGAANTFTTGQTISSTTSLLLGTAGSAVGNIGFRNATSGTTTLAPATGALGTGTVTLPLSGTLATLEGANTFTGANVNSTAGAASLPAMKFTGVPFAGTGTTSFPLVYINDANATASTVLNTAGTYFGVNGDGTQDLMNLLKDGASVCKVSSTGELVISSSGSNHISSTSGFLYTTSIIVANTQGGIRIGSSSNNRACLSSGGGNSFILGGDGVDFSMLRWGSSNGGTSTSSYPALKRSTTTLQVRLGDDSAYGSFETLNLTASGTLITTPEALAPALNAGAACGVTKVASGFALNGVNALTLANGTNGQIKTIVCTAVTAAGTATLTPTTCSGFTTVAFTAAGQTLTLQYFTTGGWVILSVRGATPA
jgi:hypothetical protein